MRAYRRVIHTAWRRIEDETVILDLRGRRACALDPAGGAVWEALDTARPIQDGRAAAFIAELEALGLVEPAPAEPGTTPVDLPTEVHPHVVWQEEVRLFASSCGDISVNCGSNQYGSAPTGMTSPQPGIPTSPGDFTRPWLGEPNAPAEPPPFPADPTGGPDDPGFR